MGAAVIAFFQALPAIMSLISEGIKFLKATFGDDWPKYIADLGTTFKQLNVAKTTEEKQAAAKELAKLASRWGQSS